MSLGSEIKSEIDMKNALYEQGYKRAVRNNQWIDIDGQLHDIDRMGMQHIANCIKMCKARPGWRDEMLVNLQKEFDSRVITNY